MFEESIQRVYAERHERRHQIEARTPGGLPQFRPRVPTGRSTTSPASPRASRRCSTSSATPIEQPRLPARACARSARPVGLASTSSVAHQLQVLEKLGYVKRDPNRPRALQIFLPDAPRRVARSAHRTRAPSTRPVSATRVPTPPTCRWSGRSPPAIRPILAEERIEEKFFPLPKSARRPCTLFLLEVSETRWSTRPICSEYVVVRQQPVAPGTVTPLPPCSTVRADGQRPAGGCTIWLLPHNDDHPPSTARTPPSWARLTAVLRRV